MEEIWKDIEGYEGLYQVSNYGRIKSLRKNNYLKLNEVKGYLYAHLYKEAKRKAHRVNRLVAEAFIKNSENKPQVNHIDGNKQNNKVDNLEWNTISENLTHAINTGLKKASKGSKNPLSKQIRCLTTGEKFGSTREAGEKMNTDYSGISKCCRGEIEHCGRHPKTKEKLRWEYVDVQ